MDPSGQDMKSPVEGIVMLIIVYCKLLIYKSRPFKGLNIRIPSRIPTWGRGCINYGSTLTLRFLKRFYYSLKRKTLPG